MDELEKVEKLRQRAEVSYEEAREALNASNGDLLDAMVYLEKQGKAKAPKQQTVSTDYDEQPQYENVSATVREQEENATKDGFFQKLERFIKKIFRKCCDNYLIVDHKDNNVIRIPLWGAIIILVLAWHISLVLIVISLFFDYRYRVEGKDDMTEVNHVMGKASDVAEQVKDEFK